MAAAVVLVGCIGALWLAYLHRGPARQGTIPSVTRSVHQDADDEYQKTVASLQREAEARLTLDPQVVDVLNENLAELDAAIASYREALAAEPGDEQLRNRLAAARQSKLEMLQQAVALAAEGSQ